jgi:hypothetical protein
MTLALLVDLVLCVLLAAAIGYAALLSRRLTALRTDNGALETLVAALQEASLRAEAGIHGLKAAAELAGRQLQQKTEMAQGLRDDLAYMIDRGGGLADRLEDAIKQGRAVEGGKREAPARAAAEPAGRAAAPLMGEKRVTGFPSKAERELRRALEAQGR